MTIRRYAVTVPRLQGGHAPPDVIIVHLTGETGPGGEPTYADASGRYRFQIAGETARLLSGPTPQGDDLRCLHALPLP